MRELTIAGTRIADDTDAWVIAEIGGNHQGNVELCKAIIKAAAGCGCSAVKLQKRDNRTLYTPAAYNQPYTSPHSFGATYGQHREYLEFGWAEYVDLKQYAESLGLAFFATAFDLPSVAFLAKLGVPAIKIASGDVRTLPLIREAAKVGVPLIISTGGATLRDVSHAWTWGNHPAFLQCTASYPCAPEDLNLRVLGTYAERFPDTVLGLSDHYDGYGISTIAYALGARIFEKHFTIGPNAAVSGMEWVSGVPQMQLKGSDQAFSLRPDGMRRFVRDLRRTRLAIGDGVKRRMDCEGAALDKMQKSYYFVRDLPAGHVLTAEDTALCSPGVAAALPPHETPTGTLRRAVTVWEPVQAEALA